ncbi:MAG: hypothetical protein K0R98_1714 [Rickettsiaceae bacterium]|jgi:hypothetical protein|nr:hypothetical protein [Rickettsiaceae bacterium]
MCDLNIHKMVNLARIKDREYVGEKTLWQSVILQAALDATKTPTNVHERFRRKKTIKWFSLKNKDFLLICALAGYEPAYVVRRLRKAIIRKAFEAREKIRVEIKKKSVVTKKRKYSFCEE